MLSEGESRLDSRSGVGYERQGYWSQPANLLEHSEEDRPPQLTMARPKRLGHNIDTDAFLRLTNLPSSNPQNPLQNNPRTNNSATDRQERETRLDNLESLSTQELEANFHSAVADYAYLLRNESNRTEIAEALGEAFLFGSVIHDIDQRDYQELVSLRRDLIDARLELRQQQDELDRERFNDGVTDAYAEGFGSNRVNSTIIQLNRVIEAQENRVSNLEEEVRQAEQAWRSNLDNFERAFIAELFNEDIEDVEVTDEVRALFSSEESVMLADAFNAIHASLHGRAYFENARNNAPNLISGVWYHLQALQLDLQSNNAARVRGALEEISGIRSELGELIQLRNVLAEISELTDDGEYIAEELDQVLVILDAFAEGANPETQQYFEQTVEYIRSLDQSSIDDLAAQELSAFLEGISAQVGNVELVDEMEALTLHQLYRGNSYLRYASGNISDEQSEQLDNRLRSIERQVGELISNSEESSIETKRILGQSLNAVINLHTARASTDDRGIRRGGGIIAQLAQENNVSEIEDAFDRLAQLVRSYEALIQEDLSGEPTDALYAEYAGAVLNLFINGPRAANRPLEALRNYQFISNDGITDTGIFLAHNDGSANLPLPSKVPDPGFPYNRNQTRSISDAYLDYSSDSDQVSQEEEGQDNTLPNIPTQYDIRRFDYHLLDGQSGEQGITNTPLFQHISQELRENDPHLFDEEGNLRTDIDYTDTAIGDSAFWRTLSDYLTTGNGWRDFGIPAASALACYATGSLALGWSGVGLGVTAGVCSALGAVGNSAENIHDNWDVIRQSEITGMSELSDEQAFRNYISYALITGLNAILHGSLARPAYLIGRTGLTGAGRGVVRAFRWTRNGGLREAIRINNLHSTAEIVGSNVAEGWAHLTRGEQIRIATGLSLYASGHGVHYINEDVGFYMRAAGGMLALSGGIHTGIRLGLTEQTAVSMASRGWLNSIYQGAAEDAFFLGQDLIWANQFLLTRGDYLGLDIVEPDGPNESTWVGDVGLLLAGGMFIRHDWRQMDAAGRRWLRWSRNGIVADLAGEPIFDGEMPQLSNLAGGISGAAGVAILTGRITGVNAMGIIASLPFKVGTEMIMLWQGGENPFQGFYNNAQYQRRLMSFAAETQGSSVPIMSVLRGRAFLMGFPLGRRMIALSHRIPGLRNTQSAVNAGLLVGSPGASYDRFAPVRIPPVSRNANQSRYPIIYEGNGGNISTSLRYYRNTNDPNRMFRLGGRWINQDQLNNSLLRYGYRWNAYQEELLNVRSSFVAPSSTNGSTRIYNVEAPRTESHSLVVSLNSRGRGVFELNGERVSSSYMRSLGYRWNRRSGELLDANSNSLSPVNTSGARRTYDISGRANEPFSLRVENAQQADPRFILNGRRIGSREVESLGYRWDSSSRRLLRVNDNATNPHYVENFEASFTVRFPRSSVDQTLDVVVANGRTRLLLDGRPVRRAATIRRVRSYLRRRGYRFDENSQRLFDRNNTEVLPTNVSRYEPVYNIRPRHLTRNAQLRVSNENGQQVFELNGRRISPTALRQMGLRWDRNDGGQLYRTERPIVGNYGEFSPSTMIESTLINRTPHRSGLATYRDRSHNTIIRRGAGEDARFEFNGRALESADDLLRHNLIWDAGRNRLYALSNGFRGDLAVGSRRLTPHEFNRLSGRQSQAARQHLDDWGGVVQGNRFVRVPLSSSGRRELSVSRPDGPLNTTEYRTFQTTRLFGQGRVWVRQYRGNTPLEVADDLVLGGDRLNVFRGRTLSTPRFTMGGAAMTAPFLAGAAFGMNSAIFRRTSSGDPGTQPIQRALNYGSAALFIWPFIQSPLGYDTPIARQVGYMIGFFANGIPAAFFPPYRNGISGFETFISELDGGEVEENDPIAAVIDDFAEYTQPALFFNYNPMRSHWGLGDAFSISHEIDTSWNVLDNAFGPTQNNYFEYGHIANEVVIGAFDCMMDIAENHPGVTDHDEFEELVNQSQVCNRENELFDRDDFSSGGRSIVPGYGLMRDIISESQTGVDLDIMQHRFEEYANFLRRLINDLRSNDRIIENERRLVAHHAARLHYFRNRYQHITASDGNSVVREIIQLEAEFPEVFARMPNLETPELRREFNINLNGSGAFIDDEAIQADERIGIHAVEPDDSGLHPIIRNM